MSAGLLTDKPQFGTLTIQDEGFTESREGWFYLRNGIVFNTDSDDPEESFCSLDEIVSFIPAKENNNE